MFEILRRRTMDGDSVGEIAFSMELTPEQVRYLYHRALQRAKSLFKSRIGTGWSETS
jgi:DNA-directed RNA polymerase specialized sigma24 family protein